jgi:hypothetical protein
LVLAYRVAYPSVILRYRLTLEVEADGQRSSGSSVIEVTYQKQPEIGSGRNMISNHRGQAVVVELGKRGTLFALLKAGNDSRSIPETIVFRAFGFPGGIWPQGTVEHVFETVRQLSGERELPFENLPMLIRFADINDPLTIDRVNCFNISERFGIGTKLVRATLEIVPAGVLSSKVCGDSNEPAIDKMLPWLHHLDDYRTVPGNPFTSFLPEEINGLRSCYR